LPPAPPPGTTAPAPAPPPAATGPGPLQLLESLKALPGVKNASLTSSVPLADAGAVFYSAEGMTNVDASNRPRAFVHRIAPGYFETLGMRLVDGRDFALTDLSPDATAVIVTRKVVTRFWSGGSGVGRRIKLGDLTNTSPWLTIVGVVEDANLRGIPRNPTADPDLFFPFNTRARNFAALLKTEGDPSAVASAARAAVQRTEPTVAVFNVQSLESLVATQLAPARFLSWLTGAFAAIAITLAIIGIYGMLSYWVRRRTAEIGIRAALGANRSRLLSLVVGQALMMALVGVGLGAALAAVLSRLIASQLYSVQPMDWVSFAATAGVMLIAAVVASLAPALRALRLNPIIALRAN